MTIHEFAEAVGVSTATIWRAIKGQRGISDATREMVLRRMSELGYVPNRSAQALAGGRTQMLGVWMPALYQPVYAKILQELQRQLSPADYDMVVRDMGYHKHHPSGLKRLLQGPADGIIVHDGGDWLQIFLDDVGTPETPMVSVGAYYVEGLDHVGVDLYPAAHEAVRHLVASGSRRVACMLDVSFVSAESDPRRDAYMAVVREADIAPELIPVAPESSRGNAEAALRAYASRHGMPGAIFCYNDDYAIGALRALKAMRLRVPHDVALVGCDGIQDTEYMDPPLSTIVQPIEEMCAIAWQFMQRRLDDPSLPTQRELLEARLEVRGSSVRK